MTCHDFLRYLMVFTCTGHKINNTTIKLYAGIKGFKFFSIITKLVNRYCIHKKMATTGVVCVFNVYQILFVIIICYQLKRLLWAEYAGPQVA